MLTFFTDPYPNELIYSCFARYHYQSNNIDLKDTLRELFGKETVIPTFEIGSNLSYLCSQLGNHYSVAKLINNHTLFPFYSPFLPAQRREKLISEISESDANGILTKIGIIAGGICKRDGIWYCPKCAEVDLDSYGEVYIHREHQIQGIIICPHDGCLLKSYPFSYSSRLEYIRLDEKLIDFRQENLESTNIFDNHIVLSKAAYYLLSNTIPNTDKQSLLKRYKNLLYERDLTTTSLRIRQEELHDSFVNYYGELFLMSLQSLPDRDDEYNWLRVITRNVERTVHPLRHILFINYLSGNIEKFFKTSEQSIRPFGEGPWPCLNKASNHYLEPVVKDLTITPDSKTRQPVGTFKCECGLIYSRRGPDKDLQDRFRFGRIKEFGLVWEGRLLNLLNDNSNLSQNAMAKELNCDPATIKKYKQILQLRNQYGPVAFTDNKEQVTLNNTLISHKTNLLNAVQAGFSRKEIRTINNKEYTYLYRHDKEWLFSILPPLKKSKGSFGYIDWARRDFKMLCSLQEAYNKLLRMEKQVRITKSILGKEVDDSALLEHYLSKMPLSKAYLETICESKKDFQIRRCQKIINQKLTEGLPVKMWELQREAGLRKEDFIALQPIIQELMNKVLEILTNGTEFGHNQRLAF